MSVSVNGLALSSTDCPIGGIIAWPVNTIPSGWLQCMGQTIQAATYPELVKVLTGSDVATSATLPDYRGVYLAGAGKSDRGTALNIKGADSLSVGEVLGSNKETLSITPEHSSDTQELTIGVPRHRHSIQGRGSTSADVTGSGSSLGNGRYAATPYVSDATDSVAPGNHYYGGPNNVNEFSQRTFTLYTAYEGSTSNSKVTVEFPSHNTITKEISHIGPTVGVVFIIKASAN